MYELRSGSVATGEEQEFEPPDILMGSKIMISVSMKHELDEQVADIILRLQETRRHSEPPIGTHDLMAVQVSRQYLINASLLPHTEEQVLTCLGKPGAFIIPLSGKDLVLQQHYAMAEIFICGDNYTQVVELENEQVKDALALLGTRPQNLCIPHHSSGPQDTVTYILHAEGTSRYKIGQTKGDPFVRLQQLQTGCPFPLSLMSQHQTDSQFEHWLHDILSDYRVTGEWFELPQNISSIFQRYTDRDNTTTPTARDILGPVNNWHSKLFRDTLPF